MSTIEKLNPIMWVFAAVIIGAVLVQTFLFLRMALRFNKKNHVLTKEELIRCATTGAVASIGPSFSSVVVALSLILMMGSAVAFMRCGVIGSPLFEMWIAEMAAGYAGVSFGSPEFDEAVFGLILFGMIAASAPHAINLILSLKPLDSAIEKSKEKSRKSGQSISFISYVGPAAMMCLFGYLMYTYLLEGGANLVAALTAVLVYLGYSAVTKKIGNTFISSLNMGVAMLVAMAAGQIARGFIG